MDSSFMPSRKTFERAGKEDTLCFPVLVSFNAFSSVSSLFF